MDNTNETKKEYTIGFFNLLKDDGDEVVVRFPYKTADEFEIVKVHTIKINNFFRKVACIGDGCPLCDKKLKNYAQKRFFCKILAYEKDSNLTPKSYVWDRPSGFGKEITDALQEGIELGVYPEGSKIEDVVFKIKRSGKHGDKGTTFKIQPARPDIYKDSLYKKDFDTLNKAHLAGWFYMTKTADELNTFLSAGSFPAKVQDSTSKPAESAPANKTAYPAASQVSNVSKPAASTLPTQTPDPVTTPAVVAPSAPVVEKPAVATDVPSEPQVQKPTTRRYNWKV
jgi:hypothetical protein